MAAAEAGNDVKLISSWPSIFGFRVVIALELKGVPYEYKNENLRNKSEELLQANPIYKLIPVLFHKGKPICESLIILDYIDTVWPQYKLAPEDPYDKAVAQFWAGFADTKMHKSAGGILMSGGEEQAKAVEEFVQDLKELDGALKKFGKPLFGGEKLNFADVAIAPWISWLKALETVGGFSIPSSEECPSLHEWIVSVSGLVKALPNPEEVCEYVLERKKVLDAIASAKQNPDTKILKNVN